MSYHSITNYRIKFRNKCQPLEKVSAGSRWYADSDVGGSFAGKGTVSDLSEFDYATKTESFTFDTGLDFVFIKCNNIEEGTVKISFDGSDNGVLELGIGEGISARLDPSASTQVKVIISSPGRAGIEYLTGT